MHATTVLFCAAALALGTSCDCSECDLRGGSVEISFVETSGDCGPIPKQVFTAGTQNSPGTTFEAQAPCTGSITNSADNCSTHTNDLTCPEPGIADDAFSIQSEAVEWDCDGEAGEGKLNLRIVDSIGTLCQSSYDVTYEKL